MTPSPPVHLAHDGQASQSLKNYQTVASDPTTSEHIPRRSFSPLSGPEGEEEENTNIHQISMASPRSNASSELSDLDVESIGPSNEMGASDDELSDAAPYSNSAGGSSDNETEAETERLEISPQKGRMSLMAHDPARLPESLEINSVGIGRRVSELPPPDRLDHDPQNGTDSSASDDEEIRGDGITSPSSLAGRKRKRSSQTSQPAGRLSIDKTPARKGSSATRRYPVISNDIPVYPSDTPMDIAESAISSDEGEEALEDIIEPLKPPISPPTPVAAVLQADSPDQVDMEDAAEADNEDDDAAAAKNEDELARKKLAYDSFQPIEKLFAIFRDKVFNERWQELTAELEMLNEPNTTHPEYLAQRQTIDVRRDEKIRLETVEFQYKQKCLETKTLATRAQSFTQAYQRIRQIKETCLSELDAEFSQIHRERRNRTKEPHYTYNFEKERARQVENQTKYNKEVSLLSGIARYRGFPAAPEIKSATGRDIEDDFQAMRMPQALPTSRQVSYANHLANAVRADEVAGEQSFLERNPWANPNSALAFVAVDSQNPRSTLATPALSNPQWMMSGTSNSTPAGEHHTHGTSSVPTSHEPAKRFRPATTTNNSSPFDNLKRSDIHWRGEARTVGSNRPRESMTPVRRINANQSPFQRKSSVPLLQANHPAEYISAQSFVPTSAAYASTIQAGAPDNEHRNGEEERGRARDRFPAQPSSSGPSRDGRFAPDSMASSVGVR